MSDSPKPRPHSSSSSKPRPNFVSPIPVILGPTGSGKTKVSIDLARELNGEIISADSRAIYKNLDLGTAKPSPEERQSVPHHGLDLVTLNERFTVADWKAYAEEKISEIRARSRLPIIAGGTGLYIDALIFDYQFRGPTGTKINDFEQKSCSDRKEVKGNFLLVGLKIPREELRSRLKTRIDQMFTPELFKEYKKFVQPAISVNSNPLTPPKDALLTPDQVFAKSGNIYRFAAAYLSEEMTLAEAKEKAFYADYHLAKRQLTWFRRNPAIIWLPPAEVVPFVLKSV